MVFQFSRDIVESRFDVLAIIRSARLYPEFSEKAGPKWIGAEQPMEIGSQNPSILARCTFRPVADQRDGTAAVRAKRLADVNFVAVDCHLIRV